MGGWVVAMASAVSGHFGGGDGGGGGRGMGSEARGYSHAEMVAASIVYSRASRVVALPWIVRVYARRRGLPPR